MSSYIVKYTGLEQRRVFTLGFVTLVFDKTNNFVIDVEEELQRQLPQFRNTSEYSKKLKGLYVSLLEKDFVPFSTVSSCISSVIDIRNDLIVTEMQRKQSDIVRGIGDEMNGKLIKLKLDREVGYDELQKKLVDELNLQANVLEIERSKYNEIQDKINQEQRQDAIYLLKEDLDRQYQGVQANSQKLSVVQAGIDKKLNDFLVEYDSKINKTNELYSEMIRGSNNKFNIEILNVSKKMAEKKPTEIDKITSIVLADDYSKQSIDSDSVAITVESKDAKASGASK